MPVDLYSGGQGIEWTQGLPSINGVADTAVQAMTESKNLAAWALGLKQAVVKSWHRINSSKPPTVRMVRDTSNCAWYQHILNGHVPHRRDCRECLRGAGRDRPRLRQQVPNAFTMAVDVAGPFAPGCDQDMGQPKYFLVTTGDSAGTPRETVMGPAEGMAASAGA